MKLLTVDTLDEARNKIIERVKSWPVKTEIIPLCESCGRTLADDVYASGDIPPFRRSTVDGYAVVAADTAGAGESIPVFVKQAGSVAMGKPAGISIRSGECAYVPTGGMLPGGADAVVMVEYCEQLTENSAGGTIAVYGAVAPGMGMAEAGEDLRKGNLLLRRGTLIRPQETGALAAAGITNLSVYAPLDLGIISTGDELVEPEQEPAPGEIRDSNTYALKALAVNRGFRVVTARVLPDDEQRLEAALAETMALCDVAAISGGSSQGEKDLTAAVINRMAKPGVFTHGLALKPGKPTILGWDAASATLFVGLPGHPVSAMMVFELILGWIGTAHREQLTVNSGQGADMVKGSWPVLAVVTCNIPGSPGRTVCQPVMLHCEGGSYMAEPVFGKSGMIVTLTRADGYIIIDLNKEGLKKGEPVLVHLWR